jgi:hypothetical protein
MLYVLLIYFDNPLLKQNLTTVLIYLSAVAAVAVSIVATLHLDLLLTSGAVVLTHELATTTRYMVGRKWITLLLQISSMACPLFTTNEVGWLSWCFQCAVNTHKIHAKRGGSLRISNDLGINGWIYHTKALMNTEKIGNTDMINHLCHVVCRHGWIIRKSGINHWQISWIKDCHIS